MSPESCWTVLRCQIPCAHFTRNVEFPVSSPAGSGAPSLEGRNSFYPAFPSLQRGNCLTWRGSHLGAVEGGTGRGHAAVTPGTSLLAPQQHPAVTTGTTGTSLLLPQGHPCPDPRDIPAAGVMPGATMETQGGCRSSGVWALPSWTMSLSPPASGQPLVSRTGTLPSCPSLQPLEDAPSTSQRSEFLGFTSFPSRKGGIQPDPPRNAQGRGTAPVYWDPSPIPAPGEKPRRCLVCSLPAH